MNELKFVASKLSEASDYIDAFGQPTDADSPEGHVKTAYRRLAVIVHPDLYRGTGDEKLATETFSLLGKFKLDADNAIKAGTYGKVIPRVVFTTRRGSHEVVGSATDGDIAATYWMRSTIEGVATEAFCKVARNQRDNDLLQNEAAALKRLAGKDAEDKWKRHVPRLLDSFVHGDATGHRRVNVITALKGLSTLEEVKKAFPEGIDTRHAIWMFRRLLMGLGFVHDNHIIHGAVVPSHVMIHPESHAVVLVDWCYASVSDNDEQPALRAMASGYRQWYPEEVLAKESPSPATDIAMAVRCIIDILGGDPVWAIVPQTVPRQLRAYLKGCLQSKQSMRPQNAWLLLEEFDELLKSMGSPYYPRQFLTFAMPNGIA